MTGFVSLWHRCTWAAVQNKCWISVKTCRCRGKQWSPFRGKLYSKACLGLKMNVWSPLIHHKTCLPLSYCWCIPSVSSCCCFTFKEFHLWHNGRLLLWSCPRKWKVRERSELSWVGHCIIFCLLYLKPRFKSWDDFYESVQSKEQRFCTPVNWQTFNRYFNLKIIKSLWFWRISTVICTWWKFMWATAT